MICRRNILQKIIQNTINRRNILQKIVHSTINNRNILQKNCSKHHPQQKYLTKKSFTTQSIFFYERGQLNMTHKEQVLKVQNTCAFMTCRQGQDFDYYYPTVDDVNKLGHVNDNGDFEYSDNDLAFLIWVINPSDPYSTSPEYRKVRDYIIQLLSDYVFEPDLDEAEIEAKRQLLAQYDAAHA